MQISCRDRNRIAIQGDVLGAAAMGVANILCLTGDGVQAGDQPGAKPVFDLDSMTLLETIRTMRDEGQFLSGRKITAPPHVFLGAAANPFAPPYDYRPLHLAKKIAAGAQFIQTQYCFDMPLLRALHGEGARAWACTRKPSSWSASARSPRRARRAGCARMCRACTFPTTSSSASRGPSNQKREGKQLCIELIQQIREIEGVAGIHVMAYRQEELVSEIITDSGVMRNRQPRRPTKERLAIMTDTVISSATKEVVIGFERPFVIIGERINPTGRKLLAAEMAAGDYSRVAADAHRPGRGRRPHARRQCRHPAWPTSRASWPRASSSCSP